MAEARDAVAQFDALLSPLGQELLAYLKQQIVNPDTAFASARDCGPGTGWSWSPMHWPSMTLRLKARSKFDRAMDMFFTRSGLEQASAEDIVARHRSGRYAGASQVADLCCGIGGDLIALAEGRRVLAVDHDPLQLRIARANSEAYDVVNSLTTLENDVRDVDLTGVDSVFIDPARRMDQRRLRTGDSEPPMDWCVRLANRIGEVELRPRLAFRTKRCPQAGSWSSLLCGVT